MRRYGSPTLESQNSSPLENQYRIDDHAIGCSPPSAMCLALFAIKWVIYFQQELQGARDEDGNELILNFMSAKPFWRVDPLSDNKSFQEQTD